VCTNIIHMHKKSLNYYSGNYDQYVQTRAEQEENQMKRYKWEQEQISHMKVRRGGASRGDARAAVDRFCMPVPGPA
jgi:ATP-binding cassette subfamily F protein 2